MQNHTRLRLHGFIAIIVALSLAELTAATAGPIRLVARTGQVLRVPGPTTNLSPVDARLDSIENYSMNNLGQAAFAARTSRGTAVWSEASGDLAVAVDRAPAPGLPPNSVYSLQAFSISTFPPSAPLLRLDDQGRTLYGGLVDWPSPANLRGAAGYWAHHGNQVSLIAAEGTPAPLSYAGMYFQDIGSLDSFPRPGHGSVVKSGTGGEFFAVPAQLGFIGSPPTSQGLRSYWMMGPAGPRLVQTLTQQWFSQGPLDLVVNRRGDAAYETSSSPIVMTLVREQAGMPATVLDRSTPFPGGLPGAYFNGVSDLQLNDAGTLGFVGLAGGPRHPTRDEGLFVVDAAGAIRTIVLEGDAAPDVPITPQGFHGATFSSRTSIPFRLRSLGPNDEFVFQATLTGPAVPFPSQETLWIDRAGALTRLLSGGDAMPGLAENLRLVGGFANPFTQVLMNDQGLIVVQAGFSVGGSGNPQGNGIWALQPGADDFTPIAITGQSLAMPDGTSGPLTSLTLGEVNNLGQISMKIRYGQYDALIISSAAAIPEPSSLLLIVSFAAAFAGLRRPIA